MKISLSIFSFAISVATAILAISWPEDSTVYKHTVGADAPVNLADGHESLLPLVYRRDTGRTKCSPAQHINAVEPRSLSPRRSTNLSRSSYNAGDYSNFTTESLNERDLWKRVMTVPTSISNADFDKWYRKEVKQMYGAIYDDTVSTAIYMPIKDEAISLGIAGLCGCTTLVVYSKTGVYMGHYFENLSFAPDAGTLYGSDNGGTPAIAFQKTVIDGLTKGIKASGADSKDGQNALSGHSDDFNNKDAKAWLIIPSVGLTDDPDPYRSMWNQIRTTVKSLYPDITYAEHVYEPLDKFSPLLLTSRGKLLWKYDPQDPAAAKRTQPHRLVKLWSEYNLLDTVQW